MKSTIYIPKKIKVGYQERSDTYTKRLAYIIYYDEKGKLRKEASWKSWCQLEDDYEKEWNGQNYVTTNRLRAQAIPTNDYDNEPMEGFVLNKKVGGYKSDWNFRQAYCRVYDPRGFEFEITVPNLLYILENANCIKGKGLEGKFVYGWDGKDLVLIPEEAPEFKQLQDYAKALETKISARELEVGKTYLNKHNRQVVYLGKFEEFFKEKSLGNKFWFANIYANNKLSSHITYSSCPHLISKVDDNAHPEYANKMDELEHNASFCPIDESLNEYVPVDETVQIRNSWDDYFYIKVGENFHRYLIDTDYRYYGKKIKIRGLSLPVTEFDSVKELFDTYSSYKLKQYLKNGKEYKR